MSLFLADVADDVLAALLLLLRSRLLLANLGLELRDLHVLLLALLLELSNGLSVSLGRYYLMQKQTLSKRKTLCRVGACSCLS